MLLVSGAAVWEITGADADAGPGEALKLARMPKQRPPAIALPIIFKLDMRPISNLVISVLHFDTPRRKGARILGSLTYLKIVHPFGNT